MYYFYALLSEKDKKYYYGSTINLQKRFKEHIDGKVIATKFRRPLRLVYYEAYEGLQPARLREQQVKASGSVRKALHKRISLPLSKNTDQTVRRQHNEVLVDGTGQPGRPQDSRASSSAG